MCDGIVYPRKGVGAGWGKGVSHILSAGDTQGMGHLRKQIRHASRVNLTCLCSHRTCVTAAMSSRRCQGQQCGDALVGAFGEGSDGVVGLGVLVWGPGAGRGTETAAGAHGGPFRG